LGRSATKKEYNVKVRTHTKDKHVIITYNYINNQLDATITIY